MAIRARCTHTGTICIVNGILELLVHIVAHFMAAETKRFRICQLKRRIKPTPEYDARDEPACSQKGQTQVACWGIQQQPKFDDFCEHDPGTLFFEHRVSIEELVLDQRCR